MIVHIFTAKRYHLVPKISKGFVTTYSECAKQHIILNGDTTLDVNMYHRLFSDLNFKDYTIIRSKAELTSSLRKFRKCQILFHAGKYTDFLIALLVGCKRIDWVCWGGDASIPKNKSSIISTPLRKFLYGRFNRIITLMDEDRESIIHDYHVEPSKITTIPYASGGRQTKYDHFYDHQILIHEACREKPLVLLGNSPHCIRKYIEIIPLLSPFAGKIRVQCMNHYSLIKGEDYHKLINLGNTYFGGDFHSNEEFYNYDDYIHYMNKCDIYICGNEEQTGLGAINVCLQLGKKIFINGKNLKWIKGNYKAVVFDTEEIKNGLSWELFSKGLSMEEKKYNLSSVRNHRRIAYEGWKEYLKLRNNNK